MRIWVRELILNKPAHNSIVSRLIFIRYSIPRISIVVCLSLPHPTNGMISYSDPTLGVGSVATFSCDPGFMISDVTNTITCQEDGQWSSIPPTCMGMFFTIHFV